MTAAGCESRVWWWDCDLTTGCLRPGGHRGNHTDGLRWWDDGGLQVDGAPRERFTPARRRAERVA